MARFSDNPIKSQLAGNERIGATDISTGDDCAITPDVLVQFAQDNLLPATGSQQGVVSGPDGDKLTALRTNAQNDALNVQLGQIPFPIFIGSPVDGFIEIYRNVLDNSILFDFMWFALASGSTNLTVKIDGTPVTGWTSVPITSASNGAQSTAANTLPAGSILGLQFSASNSPVNLRLTLKGDIVLQ